MHMMDVRVEINGKSTIFPLGELSFSGATAFTSLKPMLDLEGWPDKIEISLSLVVDSEEGVCLCSTGRLPTFPSGGTNICSEEDAEPAWVLMKLLHDPDGQPARLLSHTHEAKDWSFTFDIKERDSSTAVLRTIHVLRRRHQALPQMAETVPIAADAAAIAADPVPSSEADDAADAADADETIAAMSNRSFFIRRLLGQATASSTSELLGQLLCGETQPPSAWLCAETWREIADGCEGLSVNPSRALNGGVIHEESAVEKLQAVADAAGDLLSSRGYAELPPGAIDWAAEGVSIEALSEGIKRLGNAGFPPVFIFLFDEAWLLCAAVSRQLRALMGAEAELDEACFAWALRSPTATMMHTQPAEPPAASYIGGNFGKPHRDSSYAASHTASGDPTELSVWVPLNRVTTTNGCMLVVPSNQDPLFARPADPMHMQPQLAMPWAHVRALPCEAGSVLMWHASLIHWGSACGEGEACPRQSIAFALKLPSAGGTSKRADSGVRLSQETLRQGLSMQDRLRIVVKSLLQYEHWHPTFQLHTGQQFQGRSQ
jgi:hypothetical protein